jgi:hypothetical protein
VLCTLPTLPHRDHKATCNAQHDLFISGEISLLSLAYENTSSSSSSSSGLGGDLRAIYNVGKEENLSITIIRHDSVIMTCDQKK